MANAFEKFKAEYSKNGAGNPAVEAEMRELYQNTYNAIAIKLNSAKKTVHYATVAKQMQLIKQIGEILDTFEKKAGKKLSEAITLTTKFAAKTALKDLEELSKDSITKAESWHYKFNQKYADQTFSDAYSHIAGQTKKMKDGVVTQLRADSAKIFRRAAVEGISRKAAYRLLKEEILTTTPDFTFTDKAGRNWKTETYLEMLTRTVMANALRESYTNTMVNEGKDLVKISTQGAKDDCRKWENKVLSLTGATKGYPTMAEAIASKQVFHPRCRHTFVAYDAEIDDIFDQVAEGKTDKEILGDLLDSPKTAKEQALEDLRRA